MKAKFDDINEQLHREAMTMTDDDLLALARKIEDAVLRRSDDAFPGDQDALCLARQCVRMIERHHAERAEWDAHAGQWKATLDEQRAEVERLTRERDEARNAANYAEALTARAINERESAEAAHSAAQKRIAALEAFVREVAHDDGHRDTVHEGNAFRFFSALNQRMCALRDRARAALVSKEDGK